jgi:hypothetical protein
VVDVNKVITYMALLALPTWGGCTCSGVGPPTEGEGEGESGEGEGEGEVPPATGIAINEVMARNATTVTDATGAFADWVELLNLDDVEKDLSGFTFSDDADEPTKMAFPAGTTIAANGFLLVFCDGDAIQSTPAEPHAPFSLSGDGETVLLSDDTGARLDGYDFPAMAVDQSYGRPVAGTGAPAVLPFATPGAPNDAQPSDAGPPDAGCTPTFTDAPSVVINEILASNATVDVGGVVAPYVELFNAGAADVALEGLALVENGTTPWNFPADVTIAAGAYLIVFADERPELGPLHAGFLLTPFDDFVTLADACGEEFQRFCVEDGAGACVNVGTVADEAVGLSPNGVVGTVTTMTPSPGAANP